MNNQNNDLSLSPKEALVLELLLTNGAEEMYGLEMVKASDGALKKGTVYVTLGRMEDNRLVDSREETTPEGETGPRRRLYWATPAGVRAWKALNAWRREAGLKPSLA